MLFREEDYRYAEPHKIICIHKKCGNPIDKVFQGMYSCPKCDAWVHVSAIEWKKEDVINF